MMKSTAEQEVSLGFHLFGFIMNAFACQHAMSFRFQWFTFNRYGGQFKYMSHLLLYFHTIYFLYAIAIDVFSILNGYSCKPTDNEDEGQEDTRPILVKIRDELFNCVCFPFAFSHTLLFAFVTMLNTGYFVSMINRRKEELSSYHMLYIHVAPLVLVVLETIIVYHKYELKKRIKSLKISSLLAVTYVGWLLWVAYFDKYWSYPFLRRATWLVRILCLLSYPVIIAACYLVGEQLTKKIWISENVKVKED